MGGPRRKDAPQPGRQPIVRRQGHDVGGRTLQHGHVAGGPRHRGKQSHRGCAAADDDHAFPAIVQIGGPGLRMHHLSTEPLDVGKLRRIAGGVAVISGARKRKIAGELHRLERPVFAAALGLDGPSRVRRRPGSTADTVPEPNVAFDVVLPRYRSEIIADLCA
jgi:hypothetical protein